MKLAREVSMTAVAAAFVMMAGSSSALATISAEMCVQFNAVDTLEITTDGDPSKKIKVSRGGDTMTKDKFRGDAGDDGFVGSSHTVKPWSPTGPWKPGSYSFTGKDSDGIVMETTATLSGCVAGMPTLVSIQDNINTTAVDDVVDEENGTGDQRCVNGAVDWSLIWEELSDPSCGDISHYYVAAQCEGDTRFTEQVEVDGPELGAGGADPDEFEILIPAKFNDGDTDDTGDGEGVSCSIYVKAVMENCNSIMSEKLTFVTCDPANE